MWRYSYDLGDLMVFVTVAARQEQRPSFFLETGVGRGGGRLAFRDMVAPSQVG